MRIKRLETFSTQFVGFVARHRRGRRGAGARSRPTTPTSPPRSCTGRSRPGPSAQDAFAIDRLIDRIEEKEHKFPGSYSSAPWPGSTPRSGTARQGRGQERRANCSAASRGRLRAYASSMKRDITPEDEAARFLRLRDRTASMPSSSASAPNAATTSTNGPAAPRRSCRPSARRWAPTRLLVDANSGFSPARAIEVGRLLRGRGHRAFRGALSLLGAGADQAGGRRADVAVTGGEQDCELADLAAHVRGARRRYRAAGRALCRRHRPHPARRPHGAAPACRCTPHAANLGLVTLFTMHLLAALPNAGKYLEFSIEEADYYPWQYGLFRNDPTSRGRLRDRCRPSPAGAWRSIRSGWPTPPIRSASRAEMAGFRVLAHPYTQTPAPSRSRDLGVRSCFRSRLVPGRSARRTAFDHARGS